MQTHVYRVTGSDGLVALTAEYNGLHVAQRFATTDVKPVAIEITDFSASYDHEAGMMMPDLSRPALAGWPGIQGMARENTPYKAIPGWPEGFVRHK